MAFNKKTSLFTSKNINLNTSRQKKSTKNVQLEHHIMWMRTFAREEMTRIEAFKMWCYKRTEKISWTGRTTNEEVLDRGRKSTFTIYRKGEMN